MVRGCGGDVSSRGFLMSMARKDGRKVCGKDFVGALYQAVHIVD